MAYTHGTDNTVAKSKCLTFHLGASPFFVTCYWSTVNPHKNLALRDKADDFKRRLGIFVKQNINVNLKVKKYLVECESRHTQRSTGSR